MGKRRRKRRGRASDPAGTATAEGMPAGAKGRAPLVGWRQQVRTLLDGLRGFARERHADALEAIVRQAFGEPPAPEHPSDVDRLIDDWVCIPGTADGERSILRAFSEEGPGLSDEERQQVRRWEQERRRGVFLVQRCFRERLELWDPLEGAGLALSLLDRLPAGRAAEVRRGTVATCTYLPYMARLIAVGMVEMYADERAVRMFRDEARGSGATWHDAPPPAPTPST